MLNPEARMRTRHAFLAAIPIATALAVLTAAAPAAGANKAPWQRGVRRFDATFERIRKRTI